MIQFLVQSFIQILVYIGIFFIVVFVLCCIVVFSMIFTASWIDRDTKETRKESAAKMRWDQKLEIRRKYTERGEDKSAR